jgi:hypothetical protein
MPAKTSKTSKTARRKPVLVRVDCIPGKPPAGKTCWTRGLGWTTAAEANACWAARK